jgi:hypothetical protein
MCGRLFTGWSRRFDQEPRQQGDDAGPTRDVRTPRRRALRRSARRGSGSWRSRSPTPSDSAHVPFPARVYYPWHPASGTDVAVHYREVRRGERVLIFRGADDAWRRVKRTASTPGPISATCSSGSPPIPIAAAPTCCPATGRPPRPRRRCNPAASRPSRSYASPSSPPSTQPPGVVFTGRLRRRRSRWPGRAARRHRRGRLRGGAARPGRCTPRRARGPCPARRRSPASPPGVAGRP